MFVEVLGTLGTLHHGSADRGIYICVGGCEWRWHPMSYHWLEDVSQLKCKHLKGVEMPGTLVQLKYCGNLLSLV